MTVDQATINFDLVKSAPEKMTLRLGGSLVEIDLAHFIQRTGYETDDEGGPVIPDPDATPEEMAFYWHGTGRGQTLHLTWHRGGVFGTSYGPIGSFLIEPSAAGPFAVRVRAVNPEAWIQHHLPPDESAPDDRTLLKSRSLWAASPSTGPTDQRPPTAGPPIARPRFDQKDGRGMNSCVEQPIVLGTWDPSCTLEPLGSGSQLDILVLYTPAALAELDIEDPGNGLANLRARIENEVNVTNRIFYKSGIEGVHLVLKGIAPTPGGRDDTDPPGPEPYDMASQQMQWLNGPDDPKGTIPRRPAIGNPAVQALREAHQADIVGMVQADFYGACGAALQTRMHYNQGRDFEPEVGAGTAQRLAEPGPSYFYASGFIVDMECSAARWDFAHEVLHILGVQHDPASDEEGYSPWTYVRASCPDAFGWRQRGTYHNNNKDDDADEYRRHRHRDLMAYPHSFHGGTGLPGNCYERPDLPGSPFFGWNCPRVDRLSNRDLEWNGYKDVHGGDPGPDIFDVQSFGTFQPAPPGNRHRIGSEPGQPDAWRGGDARYTAIRVSRQVAQFCSRPPLIFANGFEP